MTCWIQFLQKFFSWFQSHRGWKDTHTHTHNHNTCSLGPTWYHYKPIIFLLNKENMKAVFYCILRIQPTRCKVSQFIYFYKTLYMFQTVFPSIIRGLKLHIQRQAFVRPLTLPAASLARLVPDKYLTLYVQFWAPDDGWKNSLKHVQHLTEINKLRNVASCWLYSANILAMYGHMNVKCTLFLFIVWNFLDTTIKIELNNLNLLW